MKNLSLLLANSDRRINNIVEAVVHDVCYNQAVVHPRRTSRVDELLHLGSRDEFDLVIVAPDHLLAEPSRRVSYVSVSEVARAIRRIKERSCSPILAVAVADGDEMQMLEAGAESTFGPLFDPELLKSAVRDVLRMPELGAQSVSGLWSFADALVRGWQKLSTGN